MRISETKVAQLIESDPPKLVIVDDSTGEEMVLSAEEALLLYQALVYFYPILAPDGGGR